MHYLTCVDGIYLEFGKVFPRPLPNVGKFYYILEWLSKITTLSNYYLRCRKIWRETTVGSFISYFSLRKPK